MDRESVLRSFISIDLNKVNDYVTCAKVTQGIQSLTFAARLFSQSVFLFELYVWKICDICECKF